MKKSHSKKNVVVACEGPLTISDSVKPPNIKHVGPKTPTNIVVSKTPQPKTKKSIDIISDEFDFDNKPVRQHVVYGYASLIQKWIISSKLKRVSLSQWGKWIYLFRTPSGKNEYFVPDRTQIYKLFHVFT